MLLQTRNRIPMTECIDKMLDAVMLCYWPMAFQRVKELRFHVLIYCISHNITYAGIIKHVDEMRRAIEYGTWDEPKQRRFYEGYRRFIKAFSMEGKSTGKGIEHLKKNLRDLIAQASQNFADLCTNGTPAHGEVVRDDMLEFHRFSADIAATGNKDLYKEYISAVQEGMRCVSRIPGLMFQRDVKNGVDIWKMNVNFIPTLSNDFAQFFSLMESVLLMFDMPEGDTGKKEGAMVTEVGRMADDERKRIMAKRAWNLLRRQGWPLHTIAKHLHITLGELDELLNFPEERTAGA